MTPRTNANQLRAWIIAFVAISICSASVQADALNPAKFAGHDWSIEIDLEGANADAPPYAVMLSEDGTLDYTGATDVDATWVLNRKQAAEIMADVCSYLDEVNIEDSGALSHDLLPRLTVWLGAGDFHVSYVTHTTALPDLPAPLRKALEIEFSANPKLKDLYNGKIRFPLGKKTPTKQSNAIPGLP
jgi:hypothetical protein